MKTNDGRAADRAALRYSAEAHELVDAARKTLATGPAASVSPEQVAVWSHNHEAALLAADEKLRRNGLGLDLASGRLEPDGLGLTTDDADLYRFTVDFLDSELRDQLARSRLGRELSADADRLLADNGVELDPGDPSRRDLALELAAARRRAFGGIRDRLDGEVVPTPSPMTSGANNLTLQAAFRRWADGGGRGARKPRSSSLVEAERAVGRFLELHGDLDLKSISKAYGRAFRDAIAKLPKDLSRRYAGMTLPKLLSVDLSAYPTRSAQTVNKVLALMGSIVTRAEKDGYLDAVQGWSNPFHVRFEIAQADREPYEPSSAEELRKLFASAASGRVMRRIPMGQPATTHWGVRASSAFSQHHPFH